MQTHQEQIRSIAQNLTTPAAGVLRGVATGVAGVVTIFVLAYLMVLEGPKVVDGLLHLMNPRTAERVRRVGSDCAGSITGYISGNLLISVICGVLTYATLKIVGIPFAGLIALFVAVADLIPLIGATLGAVVACLAALVDSVPSFVVVAIFFVLYQQPGEPPAAAAHPGAHGEGSTRWRCSSPSWWRSSLAGILGALLAIPVAGMIQVISRDLWDHRRGRMKDQPTVGEDREVVEPPADTAVEHR
ncbi:hypothetical protein GCM10025868_08110 [Angustibacter aerolatus]|uniref:AI-2E family transporter n=1 Tax=Angustibacter aerolatus TaxID=1162965 RepID=A0ABQ6JDB6_9ACTN|nr:AI-2E family transporter [Angustibacter aerolatus]GMA85561.1 hypothetical protein GCM10025868_08110 [Angustibacter aerolatus]